MIDEEAHASQRVGFLKAFVCSLPSVMATYHYVACRQNVLLRAAATLTFFAELLLASGSLLESRAQCTTTGPPQLSLLHLHRD